MNNRLKVLIFIILLVLSNLFLLRSGFWFYQDASYWPKNIREVYVYINQQFQIFNNYGYYLGYDQGLFGFSRIFPDSVIGVLTWIFGMNYAQIIFSLLGYVFAFVSFYKLSSIFFRDKRIQYLLSLIYVFNPLMYALQGHTYLNVAVPLFIYSFYVYFWGSNFVKIRYLLINIISSLIWVAYIRNIQADAIIIFPYLTYLYLKFKQLDLKKITIYILFYFISFLPMIYSLLGQFVEKSTTAFNYANVYGNAVLKSGLYNAFNLFPSFTVHLYESPVWIALGVGFFVYLIWLIISYRHHISSFTFLNLVLVFSGITLFGLGDIFSPSIYFSILKFSPFVLNQPYFAFYVIYLPIIFLIGKLTEYRIKYLYIYTSLFIGLSILPLLNLNNFQFQKIDANNIPSVYKDNFVSIYSGVPESTFYYPGTCWRSSYMDKDNVPTMCINFGLHYSSTILNDPRISSGLSYSLGSKFNVDDLAFFKIISNLKDIIIPKDLVRTKVSGLLTDDSQIGSTQNMIQNLNNNHALDLASNAYYNRYYFPDKDRYDYLLYIPNTVITKINMAKHIVVSSPNPVFVDTPINVPKFSSTDKIFYKLSLDEPTIYYFKISLNDLNNSIFIQLNQSFNKNWKVKWLTEAEFNQIKCNDQIESFGITKNSRCLFSNPIIDLTTNKYLLGESLPESQHLLSNYLNNGWIVYPNDLNKFKNGNNLYGVIIYKKQILFTDTIVISLISLCILATISLFQFVKLKGS